MGASPGGDGLGTASFSGIPGSFQKSSGVRSVGCAGHRYEEMTSGVICLPAARADRWLRGVNTMLEGVEGGKIP